MDNARQMRAEATEAEQRLWLHLRNQQLGFKFRRQHRIAGYIADFVCVERKLVVEADGGQHLRQTDYDHERTKVLQAAGYRVLRFWNHEILGNTDAVMDAIWHALHNASVQPTHGLTTRGKGHRSPHPGPSPRRRGEGATRRCTRLATLRILRRHPPARAIERANPRVLRRTRRARGRNAGALARRQQRAQYRLVLARILRSHRRRAAHALAAHLARIPAQAPARGRARRLLRTRARVPRRRGRRAPQPRIHHARVVSRRLGSSSIDWRNRRTGQRARWRWSDATPPCA